MDDNLKNDWSKIGSNIKSLQENFTNLPDYMEPFRKYQEMLQGISVALPNFSNQFINPPISFQKDNNLEEILDLRKELSELNNHAETIKADKNELLKTNEKKDEIIAKLDKQYARANIISRLNEEGAALVMKSDLFLKEFTQFKICSAVVVSIDIRRSTELMLKASSSKDFAKFIIGLSERLSDCIKSNYGVFDKFTGDGILAFFPDFYSNENALLYAIKAAKECHIIFEEHYNSNEDSFDVFLEDIGLGIGIDYGEVTIVNTKAELTVVGKPVVYACRFSNAKAGDTIIGQNAKKLVQEKFIDLVTLEQTSIFVKNEGNARGYKILNYVFKESKPNWNKFRMYKISENENNLTESDTKETEPQIKTEPIENQNIKPREVKRKQQSNKK